MNSTLTQESRTEKQPGPFAALATLKIASFRYLMVANSFSSFGFQARLMAQAWLVLELTDSDAWVGAAVGLPAIPVTFLALLGGVFADRMDRRVFLMWTRISFAALGLFMALLISADVIELWHVFAFAFFMSIAHIFGQTADQALLGDIVGRERMFSANAVFGMATNAATFIGPAIGGVLISAFGVEAAFYAIAGMLVLSAGVSRLIRVAPRERAGPPRSVMGDMSDGLAFVWKTPALRWLVFLSAMLIIHGVWLPLIPRYARDVLDTGPAGFGVILAAQGAGGLVGAVSLILAGNVRRLALVTVIVNIGFSGLIWVFAFSTSLALSAGITFLFGFLIVWWANSLRTMFQLAATDEMRGRVMSVFSLITQMLALSWLLGGGMSEIIGPRATMIIGVSVAAFFYSAAYLISPDLRALGRRTEADYPGPL